MSKIELQLPEGNSDPIDFFLKNVKNTEKGLQRYQYKLGYKEEQLEEIKEQLPSLGSEESEMYCISL